MDSDTPDIAALQNLAHEFEAVLCVDVAHDLGCLGPDGRGHIGAQGMIGKVDVVMGSFSKTFASNGGFVACNQRSVKEYLRYYSSPCTFSNALSPSQAAIVRKAFQIVAAEEGERLRTMLMANIRLLRELLHGTEFETYGDPSPIVCVKMGTEGLARLVGRRLPDMGLLANLVEFPAVPKGQARFRMQVMANHSSRDIMDAVHRLSLARADATVQHEALLDGTIELASMDALIAQPSHPIAENVGTVRDMPPPHSGSEPAATARRFAANG
jgi:glycine C-acetyltransferase